ncbi:hypothetical protein NC653_004970 [Populus alba x Populus x berolinensis]|uniref:Niemann-Pick C1 N-terminal domain-containing protein n=1 Tax=Populus alba x Populus x berolinensis TaxID=444605 RepID=A0AAD6WAQ1_9ROSI|nr:hypothetical protein NC653_004970 [Populus alba x Populus x berolinensis]
MDKVTVREAAVPRRRSDARSLMTRNAVSGERHSEGNIVQCMICVSAGEDGKSQMTCFHKRFKAYALHLLAMFVVQKLSFETSTVSSSSKQFHFWSAVLQVSRNFVNLFCELTCSPHQRMFINVKRHVDREWHLIFMYYDSFGEGLYESCHGCKGSCMHLLVERAPLIMCRAPPYCYDVQVLLLCPESSGMKPMNVSTYSCEYSLFVQILILLQHHEGASCAVRIGSLKVRPNASDFILTILYVILVSIFFGMGVEYHRSVVKFTGKKDGYPSMQVPPVSYLFLSSGVMDNGLLETQSLVLSLSLAVFFYFCLGLIRFKVETWPENGPGSKSCRRRLFQKLGHRQRPSIVNRRNNIKLLFEIQKKPMDKDCDTQSVLQYFQMDPQNLDYYGGVDHCDTIVSSIIPQQTPVGVPSKLPLNPSTALGEGNETDKAVALEEAFIQLVKRQPMELPLEGRIKLCSCGSWLDHPSHMLFSLEVSFLCAHAVVFSMFALDSRTPYSVFGELKIVALSTRVQPGLEQNIVLCWDSYRQGYFNNVSDIFKLILLHSTAQNQVISFVALASADLQEHHLTQGI